MTVQHSTLTGAELHEPKGVSGASANEIYIANGAGSGSWGSVSEANVTNKDRYLTVALTDISTASSAWVASPIAGTVTGIYSVIDTAITVADATITPRIGGTAMTDGGITIAYSGSAAGDVDSSTPSANNSVSAGQAIQIETDGGSTDTSKAVFTIVIRAS